MSRGLQDPQLAEISRLLADQMGLYFPRERWNDLARGLDSAAAALGQENAEACARALVSAPLNRGQIEILADALTVGETYFFREKGSLEILSEHILPELARRRSGEERTLRIWSAGCCTGEEPYTIAILLDRSFPEFRSWQVTLLATDINARFLRKAAEGVFSEWSFRDAPPWLKDGYFEAVAPKRYAIAPKIRKRVTFSYLNLAEEGYPSLTTHTSGMDLIFCRNVLMYFQPEGARRVIGRFHRSLAPEGWLVVSPSETSGPLFTDFTAVQFDHALLYRKGGTPQPDFKPDLFRAQVIDTTPVAPPTEPSPPIPFPAREPVKSADETALALYEKGNYAEAAARLRSEPGSAAVTTESMALLARICANLGELAEARVWAEKALGEEKSNPGLHYLRAVILQEQGAEEEVAAALRRAIYLEPGFVLAHFALGNLAQRQGKFREAGRHFTNVLELLDDYPPNAILPQSDGLAAGRLREMVESMQAMETVA